MGSHPSIDIVYGAKVLSGYEDEDPPWGTDDIWDSPWVRHQRVNGFDLWAAKVMGWTEPVRSVDWWEGAMHYNRNFRAYDQAPVEWQQYESDAEALAAAVVRGGVTTTEHSFYDDLRFLVPVVTKEQYDIIDDNPYVKSMSGVVVDPIARRDLFPSMVDDPAVLQFHRFLVDHGVVPSVGPTGWHIVADYG